MRQAEQHGKSGYWRASPEQVACRRQEAVRLRGEGYTTNQIARALSVPQATVSADLAAMGVPRKRVLARRPDPPPVDWMTPPVPEPVASSDRLALAMLRFLGEMEAERYETAHAHDVLDARRRGDQAWLDGWAALLTRLRTVADTLAAQHRGEGAARPALPVAVPSANGTRRTLREEVERRLAAGLPVSRDGLAREYGVASSVVQSEADRARVVRELLEQGWQPPGSGAPHAAP